jgi:hypothetical protein
MHGGSKVVSQELIIACWYRRGGSNAAWFWVHGAKGT